MLADTSKFIGRISWGLVTREHLGYGDPNGYSVGRVWVTKPRYDFMESIRFEAVDVYYYLLHSIGMETPRIYLDSEIHKQLTYLKLKDIPVYNLERVV